VPRLRWVAVYAVTSFIMAVTVATLFKEIGRIKRLSESLESRMEELVELTRKNHEIQERIDYYTTPDGIAYIAREEYNLVRPGEKVYRIEIVSRDMLRKE
jgi:cell division protein FtsB